MVKQFFACLDNRTSALPFLKALLSIGSNSSVDKGVMSLHSRTKEDDNLLLSDKIQFILYDKL